MAEAVSGSQTPEWKLIFIGVFLGKMPRKSISTFEGGSLKLRAILYKETKKYSFHMKSNDTKLYIKIITLNEM